MMARLWAEKIMEGKYKFSDVPRLLKESVRKVLVEKGAEHLAEEVPVE